MKKRRAKKTYRKNQTAHKHQKLHQRPWAIFTAVIALLFVVAYFVSSSQVNANKKHDPAKAQITITNSGFNPSVLNANVGDIITWVNNDTRPHQVVADLDSDKNPVLGFDNNLVLRTGDSYSFSFIHPGTYYYHDQLSRDASYSTINIR